MNKTGMILVGGKESHSSEADLAEWDAAIEEYDSLNSEELKALQPLAGGFTTLRSAVLPAVMYGLVSLEDACIRGSSFAIIEREGVFPRAWISAI
jgi:hypothetical protein